MPYQGECYLNAATEQDLPKERLDALLTYSAVIDIVRDALGYEFHHILYPDG